YDNLDRAEALVIVLHDAILKEKHDDWQGSAAKEKYLKNKIIKPILEKWGQLDKLENIFDLIKQQREYK
ncbi:MAG: hypothetical protein ACOVQA_02040, partial [Thermoflexibacteraceae bacterium]